MIARQQQMIAVIDGDAELGIEVGAAPAAGVRRRLVKHDARAAPFRLDRCREAGYARSDDVDPP